jgi:hypothetical protein
LALSFEGVKKGYDLFSPSFFENLKKARETPVCKNRSELKLVKHSLKMRIVEIKRIGIILVYTYADSNKLRIEVADFLRIDNFPELIHIALAGFLSIKHADFL